MSDSMCGKKVIKVKCFYEVYRGEGGEGGLPLLFTCMYPRFQKASEIEDKIMI